MVIAYLTEQLIYSVPTEYVLGTNSGATIVTNTGYQIGTDQLIFNDVVSYTIIPGTQQIVSSEISETFTTIDSFRINVQLFRYFQDIFATNIGIDGAIVSSRDISDTALTSDLIEKTINYQRYLMDGIILSDTVNRQTFQSRSASDLLGITDFILWRNTYQIAVELYDIVTTSDSFDYNFAIPLYSNLRIGDRVIFNNSGAIGRGRIVAISESQYTIDPFITYPNLYQNKSSSKYSNFIIMDKIQVALIPANYR